MKESKKARLAAQFGANMDESAGMSLNVNDRFDGFTPASQNAGSMNLDRIMEDPDQPRKSFDEQALQEFSEHLLAHGVQQPIQLRWTEQHGKWLIVFGHRRYRAAKLAGMETIPCIFLEQDEEESTIRVRQLVENCQREDLPPMELSQALVSLRELTGWGNREMARQLGMNHVTLGRYLDLERLPESLRQKVAGGHLAPTVATEVLKIASPVERERVGMQIASEKLNRADAKRRIESVIDGPTKMSVSRVPSEILVQNDRVKILRNPHLDDSDIRDELLRVAARLQENISLD